MKRLLNIAVIALVGVLLASCASQVRIAKRQHRGGYYLSLAKSNQKHTVKSEKHGYKQIQINRTFEQVELKEATKDIKLEKEVATSKPKGFVASSPKVKTSQIEQKDTLLNNKPKATITPSTEDVEEEEVDKVEERIAIIFALVGIGLLVISVLGVLLAILFEYDDIAEFIPAILLVLSSGFFGVMNARKRGKRSGSKLAKYLGWGGIFAYIGAAILFVASVILMELFLY